MSVIVTKFVKQYNLNSQMSNSELSQYASKLLDALSDNKKRDHAQRRFRDRYKFSSEQISIMIPSQKNSKSKDINLVVLDRTPAGMIDKNIREKSIEILRDKYKFSEEQVNNLLQDHSKIINASQENEQRKNKVINITRGSHIANLPAYTKAVTTYNRTSQSLEEETIKDMAQRILRDKLSTRDVKVEALAIALLVPNANAGFSRLSRLRKKLRNLNASIKIIEATKILEITKKANKI
ncbi:hypothetical protein Glove_620g7 [Diversispora epigaea]|uniref:Uncharacterized protein n=1 Tax=Diversispora epigaea TaxID=1348612 RepID=A0A397G638_9GLOM|nr:hypothetical protein Glove_620g7 [Diversispora epigaea]